MGWYGHTEGERYLMDGWLGGFLLPFLNLEAEIVQRREDDELDDRNEV